MRYDMGEQVSAGFFHEARRRRVFRIAAVYIVGAFVALQVADLAFPGLSIPDTAIRYVWIGAVLGFPFALFFGWRYDIVNGRILRTADAIGTPGTPLGNSDKITLSILSLALIAICAGLAIEVFQTRDADSEYSRLADAAPNSVAVLPFDSIGSTDGTGFLADGLTETLLHALAQSSNLLVTARTSSFFYKDKDIDIREIAGQLGVSKILEGSVQQNGDRVRVVAQLIEADSGFHLWSNTYDFDLEDVFAIQDSIASSVAVAIVATMTAAPELGNLKLTGVSTTNIEAYEVYVQGLEQARIWSNTSLPAAERLFQRALAIDPDFIEARKELAYSLVDMLKNGTLARPVALERLRPLRDSLVEALPEDGASIVVDAWFRYYEGRSFPDVDTIIPRLTAAVEHNPDDMRVYSGLAQALEVAGRIDEAVDWLKRAIVIDPMDYQLHFDLGHKLRAIGETQASIDAFKRVTEINPAFPSGRSSLAWARWAARDYIGWYQDFLRAVELDPLDHEMHLGISQGLMTLGLYEDAARHIARANEISTTNAGDLRVGPLLTLLGDLEEARRLAESNLRMDLPARQSGQFVSLVVYVTASIDLGKNKEALDFFEELIPGITTENFTPATREEFRLQFWATVVWAEDRESSQISARLDTLLPRWTEIVGPQIFAESGSYDAIYAYLRGDIDEASRLSIAKLDASSNTSLFLHRHAYPYKVIAEQPAVAEHIATLEDAMQPGKAALEADLANQADERDAMP